MLQGGSKPASSMYALKLLGYFNESAKRLTNSQVIGLDRFHPPLSKVHFPSTKIEICRKCFGMKPF